MIDEEDIEEYVYLVELAQPEAYDARYTKWVYDDLPILPDDWNTKFPTGQKNSLESLSSWCPEKMWRALCVQPVLDGRANWFSGWCIISAIARSRLNAYGFFFDGGFGNLGINATRFFSTLYGQTLNVGRVMTSWSVEMDISVIFIEKRVDMKHRRSYCPGGVMRVCQVFCVSFLEKFDGDGNLPVCRTGRFKTASY